MKLRNLLLTAALFVSATAAFAGTVDKADYVWNNTSNWSKIDVTLTKYQGQEGFKYAVFDTKYSTNPKFQSAYNEAVTAANDLEKSQRPAAIVKTLNDAGYKNVWMLKDPAKGNGKNQSSSAVTVINLPEGTSVDQLGVLEFNHSVFSTPNVTNNFFFYTEGTDTSNVVFYGSPKPNNNGGGNDKSAKITFGQPLPAPVVTLLIALGFGAALVMYRNRKQAKA